MQQYRPYLSGGGSNRHAFDNESDVLYSCAVTTPRVWSHILYVIALLKQPGIQRVQALADTSRSALCCHSNETRAPIANQTNGAQLEGTPYHSPTYIRVGAVVWECGEGQSDRHTDGRDQYAFRLGYSKCTGGAVVQR